MPKEMKDLQKLIEERASNRLDADIQTLYQKMVNTRILKNLPSSLNLKQIKEGSHSRDPIDMFYPPYDYMKALKEHWLPIYIEEESKAFLEKVDQLQEEVNQLFNSKQDI